VAIEAVRGRLGNLQGGFALQQVGQMHDNAQPLPYAWSLVPATAF
jgi:hypothetical protein